MLPKHIQQISNCDKSINKQSHYLNIYVYRHLNFNLQKNMNRKNKLTTVSAITSNNINIF